MPPTSFSGAPLPTSVKWLIGSAFLFVLIVAAAYVAGGVPGAFSRFLPGSSQEETTILAVNPRIAPLEGSIYMLLDKNGSRGFYRYNLLTKALTKATDLPKSDFSKVSSAIISNDLTGFAFVEYSAAGAEVKVANTTDGGKTFKFSPTSTDKPYEGIVKDLVVSPDDSWIAYAVSANEAASPSSWTIYRANGEAEPAVKMAEGISPAFGAQNILFYLSDDGLYARDFSDDALEAVQIADLGEVSPEDRVTISADGTVLAWSEKAHSTVSVFSISYDPVLTIRLIGMMYANVPNGIAIDPQTNYVLGSMPTDGTNPAGLMALSLNAKTAIPLLELPQSDPDTISIAGWRNAK